MSERRLRKPDLILIALIGAGILVLFLAQKPWSSPSGGAVVITVGGEEVARFPLEEDRTVPITDKTGHITNTLTIEGGYAKMTDADCPDRLCLRQKHIHAANETIVCLPNRVVVSIEGGADAPLDAVTR